MEEKKYKSGFVNIIGNPNVGKSTLMNKLVGEKLSIITSKAQTTRHRILGVVNEEDYQIVFSDTPGIIQPHYSLQSSMMKFVKSAFQDADVFLYMVEIGEKALKDASFFERLKTTEIPILLLINKIDKSDQAGVESAIDHWKEQLPLAEILPISAIEGFGVEQIMGEITDLLPEGIPYFPKDALTDKPERFFVSEIIREKILINYQKEVPYSVEVVVEAFKEEETIIRIGAIINVARETQKGIIIGHQGKALKKVGTQARKDLEVFFEKKVYLELFVKVIKNWRDNDQDLKRFGYHT
jgi:GTP-binding protein Era|tara:strand:+ start:3711 stop:4601 length:891 start_codon:yes stop_codon:yes gene_type:complete